jgi:hypothetical protein
MQYHIQQLWSDIRTAKQQIKALPFVMPMVLQTELDEMKKALDNAESYLRKLDTEVLKYRMALHVANHKAEKNLKLETERTLEALKIFAGEGE